MTNTQPYQGKAGNATTSNSWNGIDISGFPSFNLYGNPGPAPHGMGLLTQCTAKISGTVGFALGAAAQVIGNVQKFGPAAAAIASKYVGGSAAWGIFLLEVATAMTPAAWLVLVSFLAVSVSTWWLIQKCMQDGSFERNGAAYSRISDKRDRGDCRLRLVYRQESGGWAVAKRRNCRPVRFHSFYGLTRNDSVHKSVAADFRGTDHLEYHFVHNSCDSTNIKRLSQSSTKAKKKK